MAQLYEHSHARIIAGEANAYDWDFVYVAEMLIRIDEPDESTPRYTCAHFVEATGLCGAYEQRPDMCRRYPYEKACPHCSYNNAPAVELVTITKREERDGSESERVAA